MNNPSSFRLKLSPFWRNAAAPLLRLVWSALGVSLLAISLSCGRQPETPPPADPELSRRGSIEVTAELMEIPEGAIFKRDLYDYATVLKYRVQQVHRGKVEGDVIYVAHYNPFKPRDAAADGRVKEIGGNLKVFQAGQRHRLALEVPVDDHYMGGVVNKYFGTTTDPIYWPVWTNFATE